MKSFFLIVSVITFLSVSAQAKYDPIWSLPELPQGWSPAQAAEYQGAQIEYSQMTRRFGAKSPQAEQARERMAALSRALKADERDIVPLTFNPGTNGTLAPLEAFNTAPDPIQE